MMPKKSSLQEVQEIILLMTVIGQRQLGPFIPYQLRTMMTVSLRLQYLRYIVVKLAGLSNFIFLNAMCLQQQMLHIERTFQGWRSPEATSDPPAYSLTAQSRTMDGTTLCIAALSTLRSCPMHTHVYWHTWYLQNIVSTSINLSILTFRQWIVWLMYNVHPFEHTSFQYGDWTVGG